MFLRLLSDVGLVEFTSSVMTGWDFKDENITLRTRVSYVRPKETRSGYFHITISYVVHV